MNLLYFGLYQLDGEEIRYFETTLPLGLTQSMSTANMQQVLEIGISKNIYFY
ncbi:uncharacterized protein FIBRA_09352 [Fibroporia radiculosa]|uniref:Uncharacterized protein n=1 Tax=Fibroporia radiculosa TaxID=599839 RepID=J7SCY8_9APHY|nr:uncharacterized protein FIBRA_09352 [Fibroporia radiculosa]CCM07033.1 predicted protein [Fibroporia radiculosa]